MIEQGAENIDERLASTEATILRLSDDIGKMADRIGDMADRIGQMADRIGYMSERILETQRIQGKNLEMMQQTVTDAMKIMNKQLEASNKLMELIIGKEMEKQLIRRN